jgi:hypothetical protein
VAAIKKQREVTNPLKDWVRKAEAAKIKEEAKRNEELMRKTVQSKKRKEAPDPTSSDLPSVRKINTNSSLAPLFLQIFPKAQKNLHIVFLFSMSLSCRSLFFTLTHLVDRGGLWYLWFETGHECTFIDLPYGNKY